jgi:citrate lyase beta subunit
MTSHTAQLAASHVDGKMVDPPVLLLARQMLQTPRPSLA